MPRWLAGQAGWCLAGFPRVTGFSWCQLVTLVLRLTLRRNFQLQSSQSSSRGAACHPCAIPNSNFQQPRSKANRKMIKPTVLESRPKWKAGPFLHGFLVLPARNRQLLKIQNDDTAPCRASNCIFAGMATVTVLTGVWGSHWTQLLVACFGKEVSVPLCHIRHESPKTQMNRHAVQRLLPETLACVELFVDNYFPVAGEYHSKNALLKPFHCVHGD